MSIAENVAAIRAAMESAARDAGRDPKEIKLCAAIAERSARVQENLEDIRQQEYERKEKTTDELLVRRSSRAGREDDTQRR